MLMGQGVDLRYGGRARMKVEPTVRDKSIKKGGRIVPPFVLHFHCFFESIVCFKPVICIFVITFCTFVASDAKNSGADGVPFTLWQGQGGEGGGVVGHGVVWCELIEV